MRNSRQVSHGTGWVVRYALNATQLRSNRMHAQRSPTDFIRTLILHGDSSERDSLLQRMAKAEREEHSSRCALILVVILSLVSVSAVCYGAVLLPDFFHGGSQRTLKFFCGLGLASAICSVVFGGCWLWYRGALNRVHRESRRFLLRILDSRPKVGRAPLLSPRELESWSETFGSVDERKRARHDYLDLFSLRRFS